MNDIRKRFDNFLTEVDKMQVEILQELGERCVTHARDVSPEIGFKDQTGNLRSSIGYVIFRDGVAIRDNYTQVLTGAEGVEAGRRLAEQIGTGTEGLTLVVTAGMGYSVYVEAKGRDVLASAETLAQRELPRMLDELVRNINDAI